MKETFVGSPEDRTLIATYLGAIRSVDPIEIATLPNPVPLSRLAGACGAFDEPFFASLIDSVSRSIASTYAVSVDLIDPDRYLTAWPTDANTVGGFHDGHSLGYQYWLHAAFVAALNPSVFRTRLFTYELARSYLHDCLHHSTFRTFRRAIRTPAKDTRTAKDRVPEIFREQYGFNFRNRDNLAYSPGALTQQSPATINLNLLMDGIVVRLTADGLRSHATKIDLECAIDEAVLSEVNCEDFDATLLPAADSFRKEIIEPSSAFIQHWGSDKLLQVLVPAMMSGKLTLAKAHFAERVGRENAWEEMFMRPGFTLDPTEQE